jgi:uncharacterized cupin superfamily protein
METTFKNIHTAKFKEGLNSRGDHWRHVDLSGEHLGVRVEELPPGATSSYHHYHSLEEEHVLVLSGVATLHLGEAIRELHEGDHVWFAAGDETAHHLENRQIMVWRYGMPESRNEQRANKTRVTRVAALLILWRDSPLFLRWSSTGEAVTG